jgi:integrase
MALRLEHERGQPLFRDGQIDRVGCGDITQNALTYTQLAYKWTRIWSRKFPKSTEEESIRLILAEEYPERFLNEFEIALHTGMRRSEQFSLAWDQVDLKGKRIQLLKTKNGSGRVIPLNSAALAVFEQQFLVSGLTKQVFLADDGKPLIRKPIPRWLRIRY